MIALTGKPIKEATIEDLRRIEEAFPSFLHQVRLFISRKERLQLLQDFERLARNEVITKACWWLRGNAYFFVSDTTGDIDEEKLVEEFRKSMEV